MNATETTRNTGNQTFGLMKIAESATARGTEVGDEGGTHQQLPDIRGRQGALHQHGVDDRERGRREGGTCDQGRLQRPADQKVRRERCHNERPEERGDADADRRLRPVAQVDRIDLHPRQEGEDDGGELGDEVEPLRRVQVEEIADHNAERQFDQSDRNAKLDGNHRR
jgi:hypothetical protein